MNKYFLIYCLALLSGCSSSTSDTSTAYSTPTELEASVHFKRSDLGPEWPFKTIEEGDVHCIDGVYVVFFAKNGPIYALNGNANMMARTKERDWKSLDGEQIVGKDISPISQAGLKLCK